MTAAAPAGAVQVWPLLGIGEITAGCDLGAELAAAVARSGLGLGEGDVLVVSSKVVSKAAGLRGPADARAGLVLGEADRVVAERLGPTGITRIVVSSAGPVLAGAGIDASNLGAAGDEVLLLPRDPDAAAHALRHDVKTALRADGRAPPERLGLLITDTAGRPWRVGQTDIAIGAAGLPVIEDLRGGRDADGRPLAVTVRAVADELAAAAELVKGKARRIPAALVRGWAWPTAGRSGTADLPRGQNGVPGVTRGPQGAAALVRQGATDWFATGHVEAVRAALGVPPGTPDAVDVGLRSTAPEGTVIRLQRACRLALRDGLGQIPDDHPRAHLAGARPALAGARLDIVQYGIVAEAPDEFTLGVVVGRLLPALAAEDVPAAYARTDPPGRGHGPRAIVVFTVPS